MEGRGVLTNRTARLPALTVLPALAFLMIGNSPPTGVATDQTAAHNRAVADQLPLADRGDFEDARRGLLAQLDADIVNPDGTVAWRVDAFDRSEEHTSELQSLMRI